MRLAILSGGSGWHVQDLLRAAGLLGIQAEAVDFRAVSATLPSGRDLLESFDAVLVRTMPPGSLEQVIFRMDVLHRLQSRNVVVLNPPLAVEGCVDKYLTSARLAAAGLPVPRTIVCQRADAALEAFEQLGGDVVIKPLFGSEGRGMMRIDDPELAWRTFRTLERQQAVLYLQEFIHHPGWDLRAFVIGGRILASMRRRAADDWRTNVAQGGRAELVELTSDQQALALKAASVLNVPLAGIDLLPGPDGQCYVLEVNAVPGWRALSVVTGIDVASSILKFVQESVKHRRSEGHAQNAR
jgi:ribosomal protein S6--L-glutamate ligase